MSHFTTCQLVDYARGAVGGQEGAALLDHCRQCDSCGGRLAAVLALREATRIERVRVTRRHRLAVAASIGVIGLVALGAQVLGGFSGQEAPSVPPQETPTQIATLATTEPLPALIVRIHIGNLTPVSSLDRQPRMRAAGDMLADRKYAGAIIVLEDLRAEDQGSQLVSAYLGIARYLSGDNSAEVGKLLEQGSEGRSSSVAMFARWYLANYIVRSGGDISAARKILVALAANSDLPARLAQTLLEQLAAHGQ